eukprot:COSAG04_NODE_136_length_23756_cov_16.820645_6_plen_399_part_00
MSDDDVEPGARKVYNPMRGAGAEPSESRSARAGSSPGASSDSDGGLINRPERGAQRAAPVFTRESGQGDSDAVVSPAVKDVLLIRMGAAWVSLSSVPAFIQGVAVVFPFFALLDDSQHVGQEKPMLLLLTVVCITVWVWSLSLWRLGLPATLRRVTARGGELEQLGAGTARISVSAHRALRVAAVPKWCFLIILFSLTTLTYSLITKIGGVSAMSGRVLTAQYVFWGVMLSFWAQLVLCLTFPAWWQSLELAATLVADAVVEVKKLILRHGPRDPEWESEVIPAVLRLVDETLPLLSNGWGTALGLAFVGFWFEALAFVAQLLETGEQNNIFPMLVFAVTPVWIAQGAAAASTRCADLTNALNRKRKEDPTYDGPLINVVQDILDHENTDQGIGVRSR